MWTATILACGERGGWVALIDEPRLHIVNALEGLDVREMDPQEFASFDLDGRLLLNVATPDDYTRATA